MRVLQGSFKIRDKKIAVVVSRFNEFITKKLLDGCLKELARLGIKQKEIIVVWVPGAFEIPVAALKFARNKKIDAVICLGAVIRGETMHFELVARGAAMGITEVALRTGKPVIFGILATETVEQATKRCGRENKGIEAARNAVEMANLLKKS